MPRIETITIIREDSRSGRQIINATDFDPKTMTEFEATTAVNPDKMKVGELKAALDEREVDYTEDDKKPDLVELLQAAIDAE